MHKVFISSLFSFLFVASLFADPILEQLPSDQENNYDTERFTNTENDLYLCVFTDKSDNPKSDSFLQLRELPTKHVITSLRCDWKPRINALWSTDGKHVAISHREIKSGVIQTSLFTASATSLEEVKSSKDLQLRSLLPQSDPAWKLQEYAESTLPDRWIDSETLVFTVGAAFRDFDSGFTNVTYEVVTKLQKGSSLKVISSKQIEYKKDN